mgnify:CR=1
DLCTPSWEFFMKTPSDWSVDTLLIWENAVKKRFSSFLPRIPLNQNTKIIAHFNLQTKRKKLREKIDER